MLQKKKFLISFITVLLIVFASFQTAFAYSGAKLESGMSGDTVSKLQKDLKKLGFMSISPTGYYGDITKAAVIECQEKYNLQADGVAGAETLTRIDRLLGRASTASRGNSKSISENIINYAKRFLGVDYVWGGTTPEGFDCSGFVKYVFSKFGITLNRVAAAQAKQGTTVSKENLQPGDLLFFDTNGGHDYINHVGLYIGGGRFIQASSGQSGVVISDMTEGFYAETFMKAKRVL